MPNLVIYVECEDMSDLDWLKSRCEGSVKEVVSDADEEKRLDGNVEVAWEIEDE